MLDEGLHDVPAGHTASVVTHLEMLSQAPMRPEADLPLALERIKTPDPDWYLELFRKVGAPWLWFGRLTMARDALLKVIHDRAMHVYAVREEGQDVGLLELDFRHHPECELTYFGLSEGAVGRGAGRWMMNRAIRLAWAEGITRFHVHTCTLDHPAALAFYQRSGFVPYARKIEIAEDPRLSGLLPMDAAPHVPLIGG